MYRSLPLHLVIIPTLTFLALSGAVTCRAESKLFVADSAFNFGLAPQNSKLSRVFWLKSVGDDTLAIFNVIPGCGCTQAPLDKDRIAPGDSARLEIIFDSGKYRGKVIKRPQIQMVDHFMPQVIVIEANIFDDSSEIGPLIFSPHSLDISQIGEREAIQADFTMHNNSEDPLAISVINLPEGFLNVDIPDSLGPNETRRITMRIGPSGLKSSFEKSISVAVRQKNGQPEKIYSFPVTRTYKVFEETKGVAPGIPRDK